MRDQHGGSTSLARDQSPDTCIGSRVNHWRTRDVIPLTHASAFKFVFNTYLPAPSRSISLHPQEGSGCGRRSRDIPAFLRLFYRVNLIQGIAVVSNEGPRRQKRGGAVSPASGGRTRAAGCGPRRLWWAEGQGSWFRASHHRLGSGRSPLAGPIMRPTCKKHRYLDPMDELLQHVCVYSYVFRLY